MQHKPKLSCDCCCCNTNVAIAAHVHCVTRKSQKINSFDNNTRITQTIILIAFRLTTYIRNNREFLSQSHEFEWCRKEETSVNVEAVVVRNGRKLLSGRLSWMHEKLSGKWQAKMHRQRAHRYAVGRLKPGEKWKSDKTNVIIIRCIYIYRLLGALLRPAAHVGTSV